MAVIRPLKPPVVRPLKPAKPWRETIDDWLQQTVDWLRNVQCRDWSSPIMA